MIVCHLCLLELRGAQNGKSVARSWIRRWVARFPANCVVRSVRACDAAYHTLLNAVIDVKNPSEVLLSQIRCVGFTPSLRTCAVLTPPLFRSDNQSYSQSLSMLQLFDPVEVLMSHTMEGRVLHKKMKSAAGDVPPWARRADCPCFL